MCIRDRCAGSWEASSQLDGSTSFDRYHASPYNRDRMKIWSTLAVLFVIALAGCADGAKLLHENEDGGIVVYPFKGEQGSMLSSFRTDALALMKEKCGGPYTIAVSYTHLTLPTSDLV